MLEGKTQKEKKHMNKEAQNGERQKDNSSEIKQKTSINIHYKKCGNSLKVIWSRKYALEGDNQGTKNLCSLADKDHLIHFKEEVVEIAPLSFQ